MKSRLKVASIMLLVAMVLSLVPAAMTPRDASATTTCDWAQFVADVTVPDGTIFDPGRRSKDLALEEHRHLHLDDGLFDGVRLRCADGHYHSVSLPSSCRTGTTVDLSVDMTAPNAAGHYIGYWKFKNASGALFGIGYYASNPWWVQINVTRSAPTDRCCL